MRPGPWASFQGKRWEQVCGAGQPSGAWGGWEEILWLGAPAQKCQAACPGGIRPLLPDPQDPQESQASPCLSSSPQAATAVATRSSNSAVGR